MIFENFLMTIFSFLIANQIIRYFVYSNYEIINNNNIEMINLNIAKYTLILPIIALIYEVLIIIKHYNREDYCHKKLKKRIYKIEDKDQIKNVLAINIIFILGIIIFYIFKKPEGANQSLFYVIFLNFIIIEIYFIFNSLNNIKIRNGIYENGIFFMGRTYKWEKINDIRTNKEKRRIEIIREIHFLGEIGTKIRYYDEEFLKYLEEVWSK